MREQSAQTVCLGHRLCPEELRAWCCPSFPTWGFLLVGGGRRHIGGHDRYIGLEFSCIFTHLTLKPAIQWYG